MSPGSPAALEAELAELRQRLTSERNTLQGQVAVERAALQSVTKDLRDAREALTKTTTEFESLRRRIVGVPGA
jgi:chromosome segregation ATPase